MDFSLTRCQEDIINNSRGSLKGAITDNDSGYFSQNIESNSWINVRGDNLQIPIAPINIKNIYVNEDTLLEKPQVFNKPLENEANEFKEFEHLFYMSNLSETSSVLTSSLISQDTTYGGLETEESATSTSNISETIPIATPLKVAASDLRDSDPLSCSHSISEEIPDNRYNTESRVTLTKLNKIENNTNSTSDETENHCNSIQARIMDANNCDMSQFESFYSFVCDLYIRNDSNARDKANVSINPKHLEIDRTHNLQPQESPNKTLYTQLETKTRQSTSNPISMPSKQDTNLTDLCMSPELFSDEESTKLLSRSFSQRPKMQEDVYTAENDRKLLKRVQEYLGGVPPPPSITILKISPAEMLEKIKENRHLFLSNQEEVKEKRESILVTCKKEDFDSVCWPDLMNYRYHGLHFNSSRASEEFEHLCLKYAHKHVGAETQSSCTVFGLEVSTPSKHKFKFKRVAKSPGKRLSHLAKRRITFTRDSMYSIAGPSSSSSIGSRTRQIMVDARKFELLSRRKSPRKRSPRKTPRKSPRILSQSPSNSNLRSKSHNGEDSLDSVLSTSSSRASSTKRALFQNSPDKQDYMSNLIQNYSFDNSNSSRCSTAKRTLSISPHKSPTKLALPNLYSMKRKSSPKKKLFKSPSKGSPYKPNGVYDRKRKRTDTGDNTYNKFPRTMSSDVEDSMDELKSCNSAGSSQNMVQHRKKKLMWAIAEALRSQNIDLKHQHFKVYASVLARVVRHFLPNLFGNGPRIQGSTTEAMLRIARQYVFLVTRGKTVDQIIRYAQQNKQKVCKPTGYVAIDGVDAGVSNNKNKENVLQDRMNIMDNNHLVSSSNIARLSGREENINRIRRVINFGEEDERNVR